MCYALWLAIPLALMYVVVQSVTLTDPLEGWRIRDHPTAERLDAVILATRDAGLHDDRPMMPPLPPSMPLPPSQPGADAPSPPEQGNSSAPQSLELGSLVVVFQSRDSRSSVLTAAKLAEVATMPLELARLREVASSAEEAAAQAQAKREEAEQDLNRQLDENKALLEKLLAEQRQRLGKTGVITLAHPQSNEVEVDFGDGADPVSFPCGALGVEPSVEDEQDDAHDPIIRPCDAPTNSESRKLGILEDWMLRQRSLQLKGRHVTVMRDLNVARYYFKRTEEVFDIDQYALATSLSYFGAAYLLALTLGTHWGSLTIGLLLMCYAIFQERARQGRLTKHIQARVHREWSRTTSPKGPEETPEWLNKVIATGWKEMGGERMLVEQILEATNPQLADVVEWYDELESIQMEELRLGDHPPTITRLQFENSDVRGEFRINADVQLQAPDCRALIQMVAVVGKMRKKLPATITNLNLNVDFQLLVRLSSDNGLTLVGIKLEKGQGERALLGLDFALKTTKVVDKVLAGFNLGKLLNMSPWFKKNFQPY